MWKPVYQPDPWPIFLKRKENVGVPLMEVRKKYLEEQLLFENYVSTLQTLNTINTLSPSVGAAGGTLPGSEPPPTPAGKYEFVPGGDELFYQGTFITTLISGDQPRLAGLVAGKMYETTTLLSAPEFNGSTSSISINQPVFSDDIDGTTVMKSMDYWSGGAWAQEVSLFLIPTNLEYPDKGYEDFKPFVPGAVDDSITENWVDAMFGLENVGSPPIQWAANAGDYTRSDGYGVVIMPKNFDEVVGREADWSKILAPELDVFDVTMTLSPGSTLDPALDGAKFHLIDFDAKTSVRDLMWFGVNVFSTGFIQWSADSVTEAWQHFSYTSFSTITGPSTFEELFTRDTGNTWSAGEIASFGAY